MEAELLLIHHKTMYVFFIHLNTGVTNRPKSKTCEKNKSICILKKNHHAKHLFFIGYSKITKA